MSEKDAYSSDVFDENKALEVIAGTAVGKTITNTGTAKLDGGYFDESIQNENS